MGGFRIGLLLIGVAIAGASLFVEAASNSKAAAKKKTAYGAIAWHRSSGSVGYSYDFANARAAGVEALRHCAHPDCEVILAIRNECGAVAEGKQGFAARRGFTDAEARSRAMSACGAGCRTVAWACTR